MNSSMNADAVPSAKRKLAIIFMAGCIALSGTFAVSGCGVRSGMERVDDAKQAKKQAEDVQKKLKKDLNKGQDY
jgi:hypothetical protein